MNSLTNVRELADLKVYADGVTDQRDWEKRRAEAAEGRLARIARIARSNVYERTNLRRVLLQIAEMAEKP